MEELVKLTGLYKQKADVEMCDKKKFIQLASNTTDDSPSARCVGKEESGNAFIPDPFSHSGQHRKQFDLNGLWKFRRDPDGEGAAQGWHEGKGDFKEKVQIPGAPQAQGHGEPNERQKSFFIEPFWLRRTFRLPKYDENKRVWLKLGCILPAGEVYLNGSFLGYTQSSRTPQRIDITRLASPGAENLLAIKVCDFPKMRLDGIWEMAEFAKNWTGLYGPTSCEITDRVSIVDVYIEPKLATGSIRVEMELSEPPSKPLMLTLQVVDDGHRIGQTSQLIPAGEHRVQAEVKLDHLTAWSPNHPKLYALRLSLLAKGSQRAKDRLEIRFGIREVSAKGPKILLNGKPIYLCCYGDGQYYPKTLAPPADKSWYLPRLKQAKEYGMNAVKSCVEILPEAYLEAADEAGIMVIQEMPFGLSELRDNRHTIDAQFREYYTKELRGLVKVSRNHASVIAYSMSSELDFGRQTTESFRFFSGDLVRETRKLAPHALVIDCTGYVGALEQTSKGVRDTDLYVIIIPTWMKEVLDEPEIKTDHQHPVILHEYNWWSCYPDPADREKYAYTQVKPFWLDTLLKSARANGQEELIPTYRRDSLWLQALCRKDGVEYARRNPVVEGYILWLLIDFGQYCEGLFDDFWNPKNVPAEEFLKSNADTVLLLAKEGNRCLSTDSTARIPLAVSHYDEEDLNGCTLQWKAKGGPVSVAGEIQTPRLEQGKVTNVGDATFQLPQAKSAYKFELEVALQSGERTVNTNNWSFWAFPEVGETLIRAVTTGQPAALGAGTLLRLKAAEPKVIPDDVSLVVAASVDKALVQFVERGGKCLLLSRGAAIENRIGYTPSTCFTPIFRTIPWNAGDSGNSGSVIHPHPALAAFPHEGICDLQFIQLIRGYYPMEFSPLRTYGVSPIIRAIDSYKKNRNNAYLLEFRVGKGKCLATTLGILDKWQEHMEARYLFRCLLDYAQGGSFTPKAEVPSDLFFKLFRPRKKGSDK